MAEGRYIGAPTLMDSAEFTLSGVQTNYDVSAQTLFVNCKLPRYVVIRSNQDITVRFNSATAPAFTVSANTAFSVDFQFFAMFVTTTVDSNLKILMMQ